MENSYPLLAIILMLAIVACLELGRRLGLAHQKNNHSTIAGTSTVEGAVFALFGLLIAFTFSGAASRFEHRRDLVVQEANAIGTAYLRLDLLDKGSQEKLKPLFHEYVESRIRSYQALKEGKNAFNVGLAESSHLQSNIWKLASEGAAAANSPAVMTLVLPPINDMIDITSTRVAAMRTHPPEIIYILLVVFSLVSSLIAGYSMAVDKKRQVLHMLLFAFAIAGTIYVILDLEYPRQGFIRVDSIDTHLKELLSSMK